MSFTAIRRIHSLNHNSSIFVELIVVLVGITLETLKLVLVILFVEKLSHKITIMF